MDRGRGSRPRPETSGDTHDRSIPVPAGGTRRHEAPAATTGVRPTDATRPVDRDPERGSVAWARARARETGERQVVARALTETETVYANPDGSATAELAVLPTHVRSARGAWFEPDTTVVRPSCRHK